jgi:hypothetical protein
VEREFVHTIDLILAKAGMLDDQSKDLKFDIMIPNIFAPKTLKYEIK